MNLNWEKIKFTPKNLDILDPSLASTKIIVPNIFSFDSSL